jgi:processive 1,2-diacylglycerol beta-glucosyltransferase
MVVYRPTPGQEVGNARYLEAAGAAVHADSLDTVAATVSRWLEDPQALQRVRDNATGLARPRAAEDIATRVLESVRRERRDSAGAA